MHLSTIFTLDVYKRWINPNANDHQIKIVGRIVTCLAALMAVGIAFTLNTVEGNLFNLFQSIIGYLAPPISAVFVLGIFWKRSTAKAAITTLILGCIVSVAVGICDINDIFAKEIGGETVDIWPHFLLLSFYLFAGLVALMVALSSLTQHHPEEVVLPTFKEAYRQNPGLGKQAFIGWGLLGGMMVGLYLFFHMVMS